MHAFEGYGDFSGAKIALLSEGKVLTYLRDNKVSIPFPDLWDLPGGGRERNETPEQCAIRETREEFGLHIDKAQIIWRRRYENASDPEKHAYFMVAHITGDEISAIRFGAEGQRWRMMTEQEFLSHPRAVPQLQSRLAHYLTKVRRRLRMPAPSA